MRVLRMVAALVAVVLAVEGGLRVLGDQLPEPVTWYHEIAQAKAEQMEDRRGHHLDYLFTGTSQSYHGIDPDIIDARLGSRSYNAAIPAGVPTVQRRWMFDAVLRNLNADTVVWALSSVDLNGARPQEVSSVYESAFSAREGLLASVDHWLFDRSALFRHRRTLADPQSWFAGDEPLQQARSALFSSGKRRPGSQNLGAAERRRIRREVVGDYRVGGRMSQAIRQTVSRLQSRGVDIVFVWLPEAPRYLDLLPDPSLRDQARGEAARLARDLGVPLVDVSEGFGNDDFIDYTHLDGKAAGRLSARLARSLSDHQRPECTWRW